MTDTPTPPAHSKSEYKRLKALGADVQPPARVLTPEEEAPRIDKPDSFRARVRASIAYRGFDDHEDPISIATDADRQLDALRLALSTETRRREQAEAERDQWQRNAEAAEDRYQDLKRKLADPAAVHVNMLRGDIAKPSIGQIRHLYAEVDELWGAVASAQKAESEERECRVANQDRLRAALERAEKAEAERDALIAAWEAEPDACSMRMDDALAKVRYDALFPPTGDAP